MENSSTKSNYLDILQIFRGIAALMVVLHHSIGSIKYYHKVDNYFLDYIGAIGKYGVDFFFVLSGFIITYTAYFKYEESNAFNNYVKNRLIRIYVPYLPIGIFLLLLYTLFPSFSNSNRDISVFTSLTLIPFGNPALSVAWTLSFELCFYLLFSISFFSKKMWNVFILLWLILILLFNYTLLSNIKFLEYPIFRVLFSTYNIEFILGYILAIVILKKIIFKLNIGFVVLLLLVSAFLYLKFINYTFFNFSINFLFSILSFWAVYISIVYFNKKIKTTSVFMMIGNATYSIYLVHNPLQMIFIRVYPKINSTLTLIFALFLVVVFCCIIGYMYYLLFEKKAIALVKNSLFK
jgi:exopolysaccharide production protein ExoZ